VNICPDGSGQRERERERDRQQERERNRRIAMEQKTLGWVP